MTRRISLAILFLPAAALAADLPVAPQPREVRADGMREPAPSTLPSAASPLETIERIIRNSKDVGDKLGMTDTGKETRKTQDQILSDIRSLIDRQENPPPDSSSQDKNDKNDNNDKQDKKDDKQDQKDNKSDNQSKNGPQNDIGNGDKKDDKKNSGMPPGGMKDKMPNSGDPPPGQSSKGGGDGDGKGGNPPPGGDSDEPRPRKPRQQPGDQGHPSPEQSKKESKAKPGNKDAMANKSANPQNGGVNNQGVPPPSAPALPPEEQAVRDVWGYLPDKVRQQAMQYYKQEFMPRYSKLLEHYYLSLAKEGMKK
jgi:hypothetical protein